MSYVFQKKKLKGVSRASCVAKNGMVASKHPLISKTGVDVMKKGGNVVDAAVAAAFVDCVVEPAMNGIGGEGIMAIHLTETGENIIIDYVGRPSINASPEMYELEPEREIKGWWKMAVKGDANIVGYKAPTVPGEVAGLSAALDGYGTMSLKEIMQPAIKIAEKGFEVGWWTASHIFQSMERFWRFPEWRRIFLREGRYPFRPWNRTSRTEPDVLINKDLAESLTKISKDGPEVFYEGEIAEAIAQDMEENGGIITLEDLAMYEPVISTPTPGSYRGYEVIYDPSHAGTTMLEILNILEGFDLAALEFGSTELIHIVAEAIGLSYSDRFKHMGDPDFTKVPQKGLVSKEYAKYLQNRIDLKTAIKLDPGDPWSYEPTDTTALTVVDKNRNMVAINQTLVNSFGSGVVIPGTGIVLNNAMYGLDPEPGQANSIAGRKRRIQNVCPTLLLKDGKSFLSIGAPGGRAIQISIAQVIVHIIDHGLDIQEAIEVPRITREVSEIYVDTRVPKDVCDTLRRMGHDVVEVDKEMYNWARPVGILINPETNLLHGGVESHFVGFESQAIGY